MLPIIKVLIWSAKNAPKNKSANFSTLMLFYILGEWGKNAPNNKSANLKC